MDEEMKFRLGLDTTPFADGLRKAKHELEGFKEESVEQFKDFGKEMLSVFTLGGAFVALEKALDQVKSIKRTSESFGVSTEFVQQIRNVANTAGLAGESIEKMFAKLSEKQGSGFDLEQGFYKLADAISQTEDPATRVRMAVDSLGEKLGPKFVSILSRGSSGIKELAASFGILSDAELNQMEELNLQKERLENFVTVSVTKWVIGMEFIAKISNRLIAGVMNPADFKGQMDGLKADLKGMDVEDPSQRKAVQAEMRKAAQEKEEWDALIKYKGKLLEVQLQSPDLNHDQKIGLLNQAKEFEEHEVAAAKSAKERYEHLYNVSEIEKKISDEKKKQHEEEERQKKKQKEFEEQLDRAEKRVKDAKLNLAESKMSQYQFSLEDLANQPMTFWSNRGWVGANGEREAQGILADRNSARQAALAGNFEGADFFRNRADRNFDQLAAGEHGYLLNPFEKMQRSIDKSEQHLDRIMRRLEDFDTD